MGPMCFNRPRRERTSAFVARYVLELRNLVDVASMIVESALLRKESRGLHYNSDFPTTFPKAMPTVLTPDKKRVRT